MSSDADIKTFFHGCNLDSGCADGTLTTLGDGEITRMKDWLQWQMSPQTDNGTPITVTADHLTAYIYNHINNGIKSYEEQQQVYTDW